MPRTPEPAGLLPQIVGECSREVDQLCGEVSVRNERQVPSLARVTPVADVRDPPVGDWFEVDDEIEAIAVGAVVDASAVDHLPVSFGHSRRSRCEAQPDQYRIQNGRHEVECRVVWRDRVRSEGHALILAPEGLRTRHGIVGPQPGTACGHTMPMGSATCSSLSGLSWARIENTRSSRTSAPMSARPPSRCLRASSKGPPRARPERSARGSLREQDPLTLSSHQRHRNHAITPRSSSPTASPTSTRVAIRSVAQQGAPESGNSESYLVAPPSTGRTQRRGGANAPVRNPFSTK